MPRKRSKGPTDSDLQLLNILWSAPHPLTTGEISDRLAEQGKPFKPSTLNSAILQAVKRGHIHIVDARKPYTYAAAKSQDGTFDSVATDLLRRFFGGSVSRLIQSVFGSRKPTAAELAEIQALLDRESPQRGQRRSGEGR